MYANRQKLESKNVEIHYELQAFIQSTSTRKILLDRQSVEGWNAVIEYADNIGSENGEKIEKIIKFREVVENSLEKITLIEGGAGEGKTSKLKEIQLEHRQKDEFPVVYFSCNALKKIPDDNFENHILLLDGFEEASEDFQKKIVDWLSDIKPSIKRCYISARPGLYPKLSELCNQKRYMLSPLDENEQEMYLQGYLRRLHTESSDDYIECTAYEIIKSMSGIPWTPFYLKLVAEESGSSNPSYDKKFLQEKLLNEASERKILNFLAKRNNENCKNLFILIQETLQLLAVNTLLHQHVEQNMGEIHKATVGDCISTGM
jgi:hypothetical protein